jgi:hypothetical protein
MAMANTLAYFDAETITAVKSFTVQAPVLCLSVEKHLSNRHLADMTMTP